MSNTIRLSGFSLALQDIGEADQYIVLYTRENGLVCALGKSIRKITSKLRGQVRPVQLTNIELLIGRRHTILIGAAAEEHYPILNHSIETLQATADVGALLQNMLVEHETLEGLWELLDHMFTALNDPANGIRVSLIESYFYLRFLAMAGLSPNVSSTCVFCGQEIRDDAFFIFREGGFAHPHCAQEHRIPSGRKRSADAAPITKREWYLLQRIEQAEWPGILSADLHHIDPIRDFLKQFAAYYAMR